MEEEEVNRWKKIPMKLLEISEEKPIRGGREIHAVSREKQQHQHEKTVWCFSLSLSQLVAVSA
jgi:hypothetical protein